MHPNPAYRDTPTDQNLGFARERGFGTLAINGTNGPLLSHIPFLLSEDGRSADLHLVRSNPISRAVITATKATIAVNGPDGYISPDWYGADDQVPTWNYVVVHLSGQLTPLPDHGLPDLLERLSKHFEERLLPKPIWSQSKMNPDALSRMLRMIQPFRLQISDINGTWKLNQNKPNDMRLRAADNVAAYGVGSDTRLLAAMMQSPKETTPK